MLDGAAVVRLAVLAFQTPPGPTATPLNAHRGGAPGEADTPSPRPDSTGVAREVDPGVKRKLRWAAWSC